MKLSKIDLSGIKAVGYSDEKLGLIVNKDEDIEYLEVPAPEQAYDGLKQIESLAKLEEKEPRQKLIDDNESREFLDSIPKDAIVAVNEPEEIIYQYQRQVSVIFTETFTEIKQDNSSIEPKISEDFETETSETKQYFRTVKINEELREENNYPTEYYARVEVSCFENKDVISAESNSVYLDSLDYDSDSQYLTMTFDDGSIYEYSQVTPEFLAEFQKRIDWEKSY